MEKALSLIPLDPRTALQLLAGLHAQDPIGVASHEDLARMCVDDRCFAMTDERGRQAALALKSRGGRALWVDACQGGGDGMAPQLLTSLELLAHQTGHDSVAFQTRRRGLVRCAERQGYDVVGWILKKELQQWPT